MRLSGALSLLVLAALACVVVTITGTPVTARTDFSKFDRKQALAYSQAAIGRVLTSAQFIDQDNKAVTLDQFKGKPLIISMVYTSCYHTCPLITQALERSVVAAQETFGADGFSVLTIGFDSAEDTPERMRIFANDRGIDFSNWRFLSANPDTVASLSQNLGFIYFASPKGFDHLAQITILDGEGKIYTQVYGQDFTPPAVVEPLKQLIYGTAASVTSVEGLVNRIRLFCTIYDPRSDRYHFDYSIFVGLIIGSLCLSGIAIVIGRNAWRLWRGGGAA